MLALYIQKAGKKNWQEVKELIQANYVDVMDEREVWQLFCFQFILPDPELRTLMAK